MNGLTAGGSTYFLKNEYVGDATRMSDAMQSVSRLIGNLGTSDKASNFMLEQRKLMRAQAKENKHIRALMDEKVSHLLFTYINSLYNAILLGRENFSDVKMVLTVFNRS